MKRVLIAAAALASSPVLATSASAQNVNTQSGGNIGANTGVAVQQGSSNAAANTGACSQQQFQTTLPSIFQFNTRRAGIGPGGFSQLCDDPLDARLSTGECSAAGIGQ